LSGILFHTILTQVGDLGFASELGNYAEYSGAPKEDEVLQYARVVIDVINLYPCFIIGLNIDLTIQNSFLQDKTILV